jgi:hypothetical protein
VQGVVGHCRVSHSPRTAAWGNHGRHLDECQLLLAKKFR